MKRIPFEIGGKLFICSTVNRSVKANPSILGARHGDIIIIQRPMLRLNERFGVQLGQEIQCGYLHEGHVYEFHTTVRADLEDDITLLDYPDQVDQRVLRAHPRIQVNLPAHFLVRNRGTWNPEPARVEDLSNGGCRMVVESLLALPVDSKVRIEFDLPDGREIRELEAQVRSLETSRTHKTTDLGLAFLGPEEMLREISDFVSFLTFFRG